MRFLFVALVALIPLVCSAEVPIADFGGTNGNWNGMPDFVQAPDTWRWSVSPSLFFWMGVGLATGCLMKGSIIRWFRDITSTHTGE